MAQLNLKQIIDRLNEEFTGDDRKLVFWYDDKGEFEEDMQTVELDNAKVYFLQKDSQFYTKYFLERKDKETNYLIYAPFSKPDVKDNHLEDTLLYSSRFFADRASLLAADLGIDEKYKAVIEKHIKFFANKERTQRFYDLEIDSFNEENIRIGLLSGICRTRTCSFEEVVRVILTDGQLQDNKYLIEIKKYDLLDIFWKLCEKYFGYADEEPTLENFVTTLFVTYTAKHISSKLPKSWQTFISYRSGNVIAFMDSMMNNILYKDKYDEFSDFVSSKLDVPDVFADFLPEELLNCDTFICIDKILIKWIVGRLLAEDTGAGLDDMSIPNIIKMREKMHFSPITGLVYRLLYSAYYIVTNATYSCPDGSLSILSQYIRSDHKIDREYRNFYYGFDQLEETLGFEELRELVENIYTNEYLARLLPKWNEGLNEDEVFIKHPQQIDFYTRIVAGAKERTVVIISDAMRYEVGQELYQNLLDDPKCKVKLDSQLSVIPSYTRLGMAALLPHSKITMTDDYQVTVDDLTCDNLAKRQAILQKFSPNSICLQFDDIKNLKKSELRDIFTGKQLIYVYHNQIDARGDKANTEDEVFVACKEAITEIMELIRRISANANTYHFIVTADHGFIYKRDKVKESDKIAGVNEKDSFLNRRFIVSQNAVKEDGIESIPIGKILRNEDRKMVSFPISTNVFKLAGGGQNFVHGGSSPQEMLVPLLDVKIERGHMDTKHAEIALVSMVQKITDKITVLDFIQPEPVSDVVKMATYKIFFISQDNEKISNEASLFADSRESEALKRIFRIKFRFKDKRYDKDKKYYLVACDEDTGTECFRHPVIMDPVFRDEFESDF